MFGQRLIEIRQARRLSQAELARLSGLRQGHISQLEDGQRRPMLETCEKLATPLAVTVNDLLAAPGSPIPPISTTTASVAA